MAAGSNWLNVHRPTPSSFEFNSMSSSWDDQIAERLLPNEPSHQFHSIHHQDMPHVPIEFPGFSGDHMLPIEPTTATPFIIPSSTRQMQSNLAIDHTLASESDRQWNQPQQKRRNLQHRRYDEPEWERHRLTIKDLYIDQNLSLEKTMEVMSTAFGFSPWSVFLSRSVLFLANQVGRAKKCKEKLKEWQYSKYLPKEQDHWMLGKAAQRKLPCPENPSGKETIFKYGKQLWTVEKIRKNYQRGKTSGSRMPALGTFVVTFLTSY